MSYLRILFLTQLSQYENVDEVQLQPETTKQ